MSVFAELSRRNVFRVGAAYAVSAWLLIQVAETILPLFGFDETPARIVVIVLAIGFVPALVSAWVFELTPDGLKRERDVDRSSSITTATGKQLDRAIMLVLALGMAYFALDKFVFDPQRDSARLSILQEQKTSEIEAARQQGRTEAIVQSYGDKSIAVLPFVNMSDDASNEYFCDGISEELLNLLAKIPELRVISRTSAFSYKGKDIKLAQLAEELSVSHVLEGSVRKAGNNVRVTAQLIEARSDTHIWSETYDRSLDDIFAIQDEISAMVLEQLRIRLLDASPKLREINPEAYALFLQARYLGRLGTAESLEQSIKLYKQTLALDPNYVAAINGLATNYINQAGHGLRSPEEGFSMAREAAEQALAIDPDDAGAQSSLGWIAMYGDNDLNAAAHHFERALQLEPFNSNFLQDAASLLQTLGRIDQAISLSEQITDRDPVSAIGHFNLGTSYLYAKRWDDAIESYETAHRLGPGRVSTSYFLGTALLFNGKAQAALDAFRNESDEEYRVKGEALALYALGRKEEFASKLEELIQRWGNEWPSEVAHVFAYSGNANAAFKWLDRALEQNKDGLNDQFLQPFYVPVQADPRWRDFLERVGSVPEQLNTILFELSLPQ